MKRQIGGHIVSRETEERLGAYVAILARWNRRINLVARSDESDLMTRHVGDALQLAELAPSLTDRAIDLGSGGGFPGIVLAIATNIHFDLIEADSRKAAFLNEAIRVTAARATVHNVRVETAGIAPSPLITARAFAPVVRILEWSHHLIAPGGFLLLPKGVTAEDELTEARRRWHMKVEKFASQTAPGATILRLSEVARV